MPEEVRDARKSILGAAREGFALKGYYGTSMDFIVKKTGLSKGAIYWHFPGKWAMYTVVLSEEAERIKGIVLPSELPAGSPQPTEFFMTRGERLIDMLADDVLCRLLFVHLMLEAMRGREEMVEFVTSLRSSVTEDVLSVFERLFPGDALRMHALSHRDLVSMFVSILHGLIMNLELTVSREEAKKSWRFLVWSVFGGMSHES